MVSHPLGIKKQVVLLAQPFDQMNQSNLAGIILPRKHGFSEERPSKGYAIEPSLQPFFIPALKRMGKAHLMQVYITIDNDSVYPGLFPFPTRFNHLAKGRVTLYLERLPFEHPLQSMRNVKTIIEGDKSPLEGGEPQDLSLLCHGKDALGVGPEKDMWGNALHGSYFNRPGPRFNLH